LLVVIWNYIDDARTHEYQKYGTQFSDHKTYTSCDYIKGIRVRPIIIFFTTLKQNRAAQNFKDDCVIDIDVARFKITQEME